MVAGEAHSRKLELSRQQSHNKNASKHTICNSRYFLPGMVETYFHARGWAPRKYKLLPREKRVVDAAVRRCKKGSARELPKDILVDVAKSEARCPYALSASTPVLPNSKAYRRSTRQLLEPKA